MVDIFLTVLSAVVYLILFAVCTYVVIYYQHPDDNATAFFPKIVVVVSMAISIASILMMPLDAASRSSKHGGLPMEVLWYTVFIAQAALAVIIIPFAYFYYSAYDPDKKRGQCLRALKYNIFFLLGFAILCAVLYILIGTADVPVDYQKSKWVSYDAPPQTGEPATLFDWSQTATTRPFQVSVIVFIISILAALGGILFTVFGGIGLVLLPASLVQGFVNRPIPISDAEFNARKIVLGERAEELIKEGVNYRNKRTSRTKYNQWKQEVYLLEEEFELTMAAHKRDYPIFVYWGMLVLGIIGVGLSLTWILHIFFWKIFEYTPFLNDFFVLMDVGIWAFFGVVAICVWSLWLMWCVIKGNFAFGLRIPCLFSIHPMRPEGTLMNSFLFNAGLIVLSSTAVVQFCSESFSIYLRLTPVIQIFSVAIANLRILYWFWRVYTWAIIGFAALSVIVLFIRRKKRSSKKVELSRINTKRINSKGTSK